MWNRIILCISCAILIFSYSNLSVAADATQVNQSKNSDSVLAAQTWLTMVDQGQYDQSWETASSYFKSMVNKEQWVSQVAAVRNPLGKLVSRNLKEKQQATSLPGAPDGEYYVLSFNTVLENKASAVETVTLMKDKDGQWRLAGYFIK